MQGKMGLSSTTVSIPEENDKPTFEITGIFNQSIIVGWIAVFP
jgi:hypothetical protein